MSETQPDQALFTPDQIREALRPVVDPEIGYSIVDLGLIYDVQVQEKHANVKMTLTSPSCPYGPMMVDQVKDVLESLKGLETSRVEVVWEPPWDPRTMASEEVKMSLGMM
ncbi:MAG: metal-sulfur cluster assembly factor [Nitrospirae bacterium]|nr:metal-sulfur cluster assembly factor [Nitrospirota bacterium]